MPSYYDKAQKTWYCKFYYTDWTGQRRQKLKRGFTRQRDSKEWEREFLQKQQGTPDMTFQALYDLYIEDISHRLRASTVRNRKSRFTNRILPYFKDKPINQITPVDIRAWQNILLNSGYKETYLRGLHEQLSIILNFAVKYYHLPQNPCRAAGPIGEKKAHRVDFWTQQEFDKFIEQVQAPRCSVAFKVLYYTGLRIGELLALTRVDVDLEAATLTITKTYDRVKKVDIISPPKTPNGIRTVTMPPFLVECLTDYINRLYDIQPSDRIFPFTQDTIKRAKKKACKASGVKIIRTHDIRHSHVSMLIDLGFSPMLIAERIGDTVDMVNNIYGHLYPNRHRDVADRLQDIVSR